MDPNFADVIAALNAEAGGDFAFQIANGVRPPGDYLLAMFLPERAMPDYTVSAGNLTITPTMASPVGMDSNYPPGGVIGASTFLEETGKFAIETPLHERTLRQIHRLVEGILARGGSTNDVLVNEVLNFTNLVLVQSLLDVSEYLRGQALGTGGIDWTFNGIKLDIDYGIPAANTPPTYTGTDAFGGSTSKFWEGHRLAMRLLGNRAAAIIAHIDFIYEILDNDANSIRVTAQDNGVFEFVRVVGTTEQASPDARDRVRIYAYQAEGAFLDPANPTGDPVKVQFFPGKTLTYIGSPGRRGYRVGQGPQEEPQDRLAVGYSHLAPTTESGGRPGRWAEVYTPEKRPMAVHGRAVQNFLPVIENEKNIVILTSE